MVRRYRWVAKVRARSEIRLRRRLAGCAAVALLGGLGTASLALVAPAGASVTINVPCNGGDSAALIAAIDAANASGGGTINLATGCTYIMTSAADPADNTGLPKITTRITINGSGTTITRKATAPDFRIFLVDTTGNLTLNSVAVTGGRASDGGGILNTNGGTLTLNGSRVDYNAVTLGFLLPTPKTSGGGISNENGLTVTLNNSQVDHNAATGTGNAIAAGGGLYENNGGTFVLNSSRVDHNTVTATEGAFGGAIGVDFAGPPRTVVLNSSVVDNNVAVTTGSVGDIHAKGGGIQNNGPTLTLDSSQVIDNTASAPGGEALGGGISSLSFKNSSQPDPDGLLSLSSSQVRGNTASGNSAAGGGISNQVGTARIASSEVDNNTASATGAAGARGGGIENFHVTEQGGAPPPSLTMTATQLSNNTVSTSGKPARGGGLFNSGSARLNSSAVTSDSATGSPAHGGGIFNDSDGTATLNFSAVTGNTATGTTGDGGGIFNNGGAVTLNFSAVIGNNPNNCGKPSTVPRCSG